MRAWFNRGNIGQMPPHAPEDTVYCAALNVGLTHVPCDLTERAQAFTAISQFMENPGDITARYIMSGLDNSAFAVCMADVLQGAIVTEKAWDIDLRRPGIATFSLCNAHLETLKETFPRDRFMLLHDENPDRLSTKVWAISRMISANGAVERQHLDA